MEIALIVFFIVLLTELLEIVSYKTVASKCWHLWRDTVRKQETQRHSALRHDIITLKHQLRQTSSQDEFAKWAKMRRRLDALIAENDKLTNRIAYARTAFELKISVGCWVAVYGFRALIVLLYHKSPMFFLPLRWFDPMTPLLSYPSAPKGSVSVYTWSFACHRALRIMLRLSGKVYSRAISLINAQQHHQQQQQEKVKVRSSR
ncbi:hypothetical protein GQ42DRAFT_32615 [Ramicandelaber brevisporus]|nr:hypothetical protein GQ42DRAFT_32615 [Ramicandelaber brevisporus]